MFRLLCSLVCLGRCIHECVMVHSGHVHCYLEVVVSTGVVRLLWSLAC